MKKYLYSWEFPFFTILSNNILNLRFCRWRSSAADFPIVTKVGNYIDTCKITTEDIENIFQVH